MEQNLAIRRFDSPNNSEWVPCPWPINCDTFEFREINGKSFDLTTDPENPEAWDTMKQSFDFQNKRHYNATRSRFIAGECKIWIRSTDANPVTVVGYFGL